MQYCNGRKSIAVLAMLVSLNNIAEGGENKHKICETSKHYAKVAFVEKENNVPFAAAIESLSILLDLTKTNDLQPQEIAALKMLAYDAYEIVFNSDSESMEDTANKVESECNNKMDDATTIFRNRVELCQILIAKMHHAAYMKNKGLTKVFALEILREGDNEIDGISAYGVETVYKSDDDNIIQLEKDKCLRKINER